MEIQDIKANLTIATVLQHYGLHPDKHNKLCCPFHKEKTPSLVIYPKTNTFHCFGCGISGDTIELIQLKENLGKHEAILKAESFLGVPPKIHDPEHKPKQKPEKPKPPEEPEQDSFAKLFYEFSQNLKENPKAKEYLKSRKLNPETLEAGYNNGSYDKLKHCIVFPLKDKQGNIVSLYGRSIIGSGDNKHFYTKDRQGLYPNYPKQETRKLILTEAIIDTASLLEVPEITSSYEVLSCYGTNGLTNEHQEAIKELHNLEEIIFFFDGDKAGLEGIKHNSLVISQLQNTKISYVETPQGEDINSLWQGHESELFTHLLESRKPFSFLPAEGTQAGLTEPSHTQIPEPTTPISKLAHCPISTLNTANPYNLSYTGLTAIYYIKGGIRPQLDSMRVSLQIVNPQTSDDYRTKLDLYEYKQVSATSTAAAEKLTLRNDLIEKDLSRLTTLLEDYRDMQQTNNPNNMEAKKCIRVPEAMVSRCHEFLRKPGLINNINALIEKSGITGEETNRILLFVIASSYKMPDTLHALVQGSSGSGKTHLILKVAQLMPAEDTITLTRVTDSSFYNYGENDLMHKLLCMEDLDGMKEEAFLAFRELQSRGMLTSSTSVKDENGNIRGMVKLVKGPVASLSATTKGEIYEDNMSRCFLVAVDESKEQSQRIVKHQNDKAAGLVDMQKESELKAFIQNCIRLLKPCQVVNPYAKQIELPEEAHKVRRLNELYQSFVKQVTLLNQYQRRKDVQGRLIAEKEDLQTACEILFESIILKVDELDGSLRQFYEQLKDYLKKQGSEYQNYQFSQREIRQTLNISKTQVQRYINDLLALEYIQQSGGYANKGFKYKITYWDNIQHLRAKIREHLQKQIEAIRENTLVNHKPGPLNGSLQSPTDK